MSIVHTDKTSLGAYDKETGRLVLVCINKKAKDEDVTASFHAFQSEMRKITPIRTSGDIKDGEHWNELPSFTAEENEFTYSLKGNSVTTFLIDKV